MILCQLKTAYVPDLEKQILFDQIYIEEYCRGDIVCYLKDVSIRAEVLTRLKELSDFRINIYGFEKIGNKVKLKEKEVLTVCNLFKIEKQYCVEYDSVNLEFKVGGVIESDSISGWEYDLENILKL